MARLQCLLAYLLLQQRASGTPEDIARAALFLASANADWITGIVLDIAGGAVMV